MNKCLWKIERNEKKLSQRYKFQYRNSHHNRNTFTKCCQAFAFYVPLFLHCHRHLLHIQWDLTPWEHFFLLTAEFQSATFWLHFEEHHSLIHSRSMFFPVQFGFFFSWYDWDLCQEKIIDLKNGQEVPKDREIVSSTQKLKQQKKMLKKRKTNLVWNMSANEKLKYQFLTTFNVNIISVCK